MCSVRQSVSNVSPRKALTSTYRSIRWIICWVNAVLYWPVKEANSGCPDSELYAQIIKYCFQDLRAKTQFHVTYKEDKHCIGFIERWEVWDCILEPQIALPVVMETNWAKIKKNTGSMRRKCFSLWNSTSTFCFIVSLIFPCLACYETKLQVGTLKIPLLLLMTHTLSSCTSYPHKDDYSVFGLVVFNYLWTP